MKLTKVQQQRRDSLVSALTDAKADLERAIDVCNAALLAARNAIAVPLATYNAALEEARAWQEEVALECQTAIFRKSRRWQNGDEGRAAQKWIERLDEVDLQDVYLDEPEDIDPPDLRHAEELANAGVEAE